MNRYARVFYTRSVACVAFSDVAYVDRFDGSGIQLKLTIRCGPDFRDKFSTHAWMAYPRGACRQHALRSFKKQIRIQMAAVVMDTLATAATVAVKM